MIVLAICGVLLLIAVVAMARHGRHFRGSRAHFEAEERPEPKLSKALWPPGGDGGVGL